MCASVVTCMDTPPVLEPAEHILDLVTLAVEHTVVLYGLSAVGFWRNARGDAPFGESVTEPIGVVAFVAQKFLGFRQV